MRISIVFRLFIVAIVTSTVFYSCSEKEEFITENVSDYLPLATGKYITYRLDSLVFTQFNRVSEIHRYQVKDQVDALVTDNIGRPAYRVYRYIRDSTGTQPWQPSGTYLITVLPDQIEVVEDNLRFIKLHMPVKDGFSWRGNRYAPDDPYLPLGYNFSNDNVDVFPFWDYYYDGAPTGFSYRGKNYTDVITVEQQDEVTNVPILAPGSYASKSRAVERYSKNIGLVFKQYELWEYQPDPTGGPNYNYFGFGVTMWMIDHN